MPILGGLTWGRLCLNNKGQRWFLQIDGWTGRRASGRAGWRAGGPFRGGIANRKFAVDSVDLGCFCKNFFISQNLAATFY